MTSALIAKLESASEGSRDLDADVAGVFSHDVESDDGDFWWGPWNEQSTRVPDFTTSIDAALALAGRVLPEWCWETRIDDKGATVGCAPAWWNEGLEAVDCGGVIVDAATPALAICAALLRASAAEGAG